MNEMTEKCFMTKNAEETMQLGIQIGKSLKGGEIIELVSDLGGGKTTITKGIAEGLGSKDLVSSPTFTISNIYRGDKLVIHHYDFYRIGELGIMSEELQETINDPEAVSIIEWAGEAHDLLPKERLVRVQLLPQREDENMRSIVITCNDEKLLGRLKEYSV